MLLKAETTKGGTPKGISRDVNNREQNWLRMHYIKKKYKIIAFFTESKMFRPLTGKQKKLDKHMQNVPTNTMQLMAVAVPWRSAVCPRAASRPAGQAATAGTRVRGGPSWSQGSHFGPIGARFLKFGPLENDLAPQFRIWH